MSPTFPFVPERASSVAGEVDALFLFILVVTGIFAAGVWIALLYFAIRYRRRSPDDRPPEIHGSLVLELTWTVVPLVLMSVMFVWGAKVFFHLNRPPDDAMTVSVVGKRWMW
ncbi:MAG TPA: cytochrome c oxidase subunit II transmembrane domain-containing protein, partial [Vicinamibacteria bacterium]|nr:cytochrome c oxidase subunit II transmembrane domain-containing protein [Vicinamibacteria bacterium]